MNGVKLMKMRPTVFLTELPLMILLAVCWRFNGESEGLLKLYPLIIALMALIIFLAFYFFRLVEISWEEIRDIGLFTRRDSATVNKGMALSILLTPKGTLKLTLLSKCEVVGFDWVKPTDERHELAIYRGNAYGAERAVRRLLTYFGAGEQLEAILGDADFSCECRYSDVSAQSTDEGRSIRININETLTANGIPIARMEPEA